MKKAIKTVYGGHKFRSRTEARWAVFFDKLKIPYLYESEGYDLDGLWYLPDFWIESWNAFVEIKGPVPDDVEIRKCNDLLISTGMKVLLFYGSCDKGNHRVMNFINNKYQSEYDDELWTLAQSRRCPNIFIKNTEGGILLGHPKARFYKGKNPGHYCCDRIPLMHKEVELAFDYAKIYRFD